MNYWNECISGAFEEFGISADKEQIDNVIAWVEGAHENYSMATGEDVANKNYISDEARELNNIKSEQEKERIWVCNTIPCKSCTTTGTVQDGWGRDVACDRCNGEGRHR